MKRLFMEWNMDVKTRRGLVAYSDWYRCTGISYMSEYVVKTLSSFFFFSEGGGVQEGA